MPHVTLSDDAWSTLATIASLQDDLNGTGDVDAQESPKEDADAFICFNLRSKMEAMLTSETVAAALQSASPHVAASLLRLAQPSGASDARTVLQIVIARCAIVCACTALVTGCDHRHVHQLLLPQQFVPDRAHTHHTPFRSRTTWACRAH